MRFNRPVVFHRTVDARAGGDETVAFLFVEQAFDGTMGHDRHPSTMSTPTLPVIAPLLDSDDLGHLLAEACSHNNPVMVRHYLGQGASPYSTSHLGQPAWEVAFTRDMNALLPLLLDAGLRPTESYHGQPLLIAAMTNGSIALINDLIARGANPAEQDRLGRGMVYAAVANPDPNVLGRAIELNPAQLNERIGRQQDTALHQVAYDSRDAADLAQLLLDAGIDPAIRTLDGHTAADIARQERHLHTLTVIERALLHQVHADGSDHEVPRGVPRPSRSRL